VSNAWPVAPLRDVLVQDREYVTALEPREYPKLSVKLYGKGVTLDSPADATQLKMQRHQFAKAGQVILSEIWGKKGAIGFVPPEGEGALCTSHFFLFDLLRDKLDPGWLAAIFRADYLAEQLGASAFGTTGYAAVRPKDLLAASIPLPSLPEQRRIVAKVKELAANIGEARGLRRRAIDENTALEKASVDHIYHEQLKECGPTALAEVCISLTDGDHLTPTFSEQGVPFIFVGNVSTGKLHFRDCKSVAEDYFRALSDLRKPCRGDVLYSAVGATLGIPVVVDSDAEFCFQRHIAILKPDRTKVLSDYMRHMLRSATVFDKAWQSTTGTAQPTIPLRAIRALEIPVPALSEQRRIVAYLDDLQARMDCLKALQTQTHAELDALLPSILDKAFKGEL
jgi:type I restriction enzyme, S subunit